LVKAIKNRNPAKRKLFIKTSKSEGLMELNNKRCSVLLKNINPRIESPNRSFMI
jgi:hypothetical protein